MTWQGFVGGIASATMLGAALSSITPFSIPETGLMALIVGLTGRSKRDRGVKGWGR